MKHRWDVLDSQSSVRHPWIVWLTVVLYLNLLKRLIFWRYFFLINFLKTQKICLRVKTLNWLNFFIGDLAAFFLFRFGLTLFLGVTLRFSICVVIWLTFECNVFKGFFDFSLSLKPFLFWSTQTRHVILTNEILHNFLTLRKSIVPHSRTWRIFKCSHRTRHLIGLLFELFLIPLFLFIHLYN